MRMQQLLGTLCVILIFFVSILNVFIYDNPYKFRNYNHPYRLYDSKCGRLLQADTMIPNLTSQGRNRYAYGYNNPIKYTDPDGHVPQTTSQNPSFTGFIRESVQAYSEYRQSNKGFVDQIMFNDSLVKASRKFKEDASSVVYMSKIAVEDRSVVNAGGHVREALQGFIGDEATIITQYSNDKETVAESVTPWGGIGGPYKTKYWLIGYQLNFDKDPQENASRVAWKLIQQALDESRSSFISQTEVGGPLSTNNTANEFPITIELRENDLHFLKSLGGGGATRADGDYYKVTVALEDVELPGHLVPKIKSPFAIGLVHEAILHAALGFKHNFFQHDERGVYDPTIKVINEVFVPAWNENHPDQEPIGERAHYYKRPPKDKK